MSSILDRLTFRTAADSETVPARKTPKGTSFEATGLAPPTPDVDTEYGSSQPVVMREVVPELASATQRLATYNRMLQDAGVDMSMRAVKTPILGAEFFVEPYSNEPLDLEIAEFIWANLAEGMSAPLLNSMQDVLKMFEDGYAVVEKVYELREWAPGRKAANSRKYTMLRKLGARPSSTVKEIQYDDEGGPSKVTQNAIRADKKVEEVDLDIFKVMIFTFGRVGGDLTGKSLLRTAYPHWYYKTHFYKIDAVQKERHSLGIPKGKLMAGFTPNDKILLRQLLRNLRTNEEAFMLLPPNVDVEFAKVEGQLVNVLESASHHNMMILMNVMAQFLTLGIDTAGGGRATAGSQSDLFMKSLKYIANYIAETINMYLIPELVVWNYKTKNFPKLQVRNIGETRDLQQLASAIANLVAQTAVTMDEDTEQWVRKAFDMPAKKEPRPQTVGASEKGAGASDDTPQKGNVKPGDASDGGNAGKPPTAAE
jgi:Protein of unknown function (DUF935)